MLGVVDRVTHFITVNVWRAGPTDRSLDSGSRGSSRGVRPLDSERKILWDALCLPPPRRRSEVGGAEPEIWWSPNQKRSITIPYAERRTLKKIFMQMFRSFSLEFKRTAYGGRVLLDLKVPEKLAGVQAFALVSIFITCPLLSAISM